VRLAVTASDLNPIYSADFEFGAGSEWSRPITEATPVGGRRFLGQFATESVTLSVPSLPPHEALAVTFDLLLLRSWDGNATGDIGPDQWKLAVVGGRELVNSTFSNWRTIPVGNTQYFPDPFRSTDFCPPLTGAEEENTLGYTHAGAPMDSIYHITRTFDHTGSAVTLQFSGIHLQPIGDESWGLDNVNLYIMRAPAIHFTILPLYGTAGGSDDGNIHMRLGGLDHNGTVVVESSTNLLPGSWLPVMTNISATGELHLSQPRTGPAHFYRARAL
jgi:hypothetical protein